MGHKTPDCDGKPISIGTLARPRLVKCPKCRAAWDAAVEGEDGDEEQAPLPKPKDPWYVITHPIYIILLVLVPVGIAFKLKQMGII